MSLVGGYAASYALQPPPPAEQLYGSYYARLEAAEAANSSPASQQSYFQGWTFAGSPETEFGSPPPPYTPSPSELLQEGLPAASMTLGGSDYASLSAGASDPKADCSGGFGLVRPVKRRCTANRKERRRTLSINNAFADLRDCIPNVPADTKLSKIKTLRLATSYIAYLMDILAQDPRDHQTQHRSDFRADLCRKSEGYPREQQEPCMVKARKAAEVQATLGSAAAASTEKKTKGRTGWPQHVWALELKHDP